MKKTLFVLIGLLMALAPFEVLAAAKVMNPGEAVGQLVVLGVEDVLQETPKYKALSPLSIPVFAELPLDLSVVAGSITLKQQTLLSHVQLKSRARGTPNLDISELEGGMSNPLLSAYQDGDWIRLVLGKDGSILIEKSSESDAVASYNRKKATKINLEADLNETRILRTEDLRSPDFVRVGSKAANYGELAALLNTADRTVVRPGFGIPFFYYQEYIETNPKIKTAIEKILKDPLMSKVAKVSYREEKLKALQELMTSKEAVVSEKLIDELLSRFEQIRAKGLPRKIKLRSSTNSEDLPNFNGAGLYTSAAYNPLTKEGKERTTEKKRQELKETLQTVWASVWNLRAFDERNFFAIPHAQVKMGTQVNISFANEGADGVVVTKNIAGEPSLTGPGVYIEVQRGSKYSVTNPVAGVKPQKILVRYKAQDALNQASYDVNVLQNSNIADDNKTVLTQDNPKPVLTEAQIKDLAYQVLKAHFHFKARIAPNDPDFSLDLEFKLDAEDTGVDQIYLKQARPYID